MTTSRLSTRRLTLSICSLILVFVVAAPLLAQAEEEDREKSDVSTSQDAERSGETDEDEAQPQEDDATRETRRTRERSVTPKDASGQNVSPLVRAANSSTKKKSSVRSYTDADLSSSKGKLIVIEGTNVREPEIVPISERSPGAVQGREGSSEEEQMTPAQRQNEAKLLREQISTLETELRKLESEYYTIEEGDHREVVERTFDQKREALAEAKEKLSKIQSGGSQ